MDTPEIIEAREKVNYYWNNCMFDLAWMWAVILFWEYRIQATAHCYDSINACDLVSDLFDCINIRR